MSTATLKDGQVLIKGRISYPKVFKPEHFKNDTATPKRYGCQVLMPKSDTEGKAAIDKEIDRLTKQHFKGKKPKTKDLPIKDGDGEDGDEHSKGCWIISANRAESQGRPTVVDRQKQPIVQEDGKLFAGYHCRFILGIYKPKTYDIISASLELVQVLREGEVIGAAPVSADDLPDLDDDEDDGLGDD